MPTISLAQKKMKKAITVDEMKKPSKNRVAVAGSKEMYELLYKGHDAPPGIECMLYDNEEVVDNWIPDEEEIKTVDVKAPDGAVKYLLGPYAAATPVVQKIFSIGIKGAQEFFDTKSVK